jgi:hypothetical protein
MFDRRLDHGRLSGGRLRDGLGGSGGRLARLLKFLHFLAKGRPGLHLRIGVRRVNGH